ncbi:MAG: hypothetical protein ACO23O_01950 [Ilumatobacteraceae bacterium]
MSAPDRGQRAERHGDVSLAVQVVIFQNPVAQLRRLAAAIGATIRIARSERGLGEVAVRWGDCSPEPVLDDEVGAHLARLVGDGVDVSTTWFGANLGSGGGSNALAALGDEDRLWVLNPDTYPAPSCASELLAAVEPRDVAAADARQLPIEHPKSYDPTTGDTGWVSGACMMIDRVAFDAVGGFDDHFFPLYCDDVDLSWRLRLGGGRTVHAPRAVVFHDKRPDADGGVRWSPHEARSSTLARLWLTRRYGRPDLTAELVTALERSTDDVQRSIAHEFRTREAAGDVPEVVSGAADVAHFVDGQYAPRRFSYLA